MSMVEIYLPQPLFVLSNQCVTQRSRLRVLLHFTDNTYNFGVFCFGLANCYFADRGAKQEKKKLNHPVRDKNGKNVNKVGRTWGDGMTVKAVWHIVKESAKRIGVAQLAPYDLRRTCA